MSTSPAFVDSKQVFDNLIEYWASTRIDVPMQLLAKFDNAAKRLVTLGTIWQGVYLAAFNFGDLRQSNSRWYLVVAFLFLIGLIVCSALAICVPPPKAGAFDTYLLFDRQGGPSDKDLTCAVKRWCHDIDAIATKKHRLLVAAKVFFLLNSVALIALLISMVR
jgi:hypothetical protein